MSTPNPIPLPTPPAGLRSGEAAEPMLRRDAAREAWIKRYAGYFGDPLYLDQYRRREISFAELHKTSVSHAEDQANEAGRYDPDVDYYDETPNPSGPSAGVG